MEDLENTVSQAAGLRLKIVGVGGAASRTVARLCAAKKFSAEFVAVDTCKSELDALLPTGVKTVLIGENVTGAIGAGTDAARGAAAAKDSEDVLRQMLAGTDLLLLVTALGRGTGSGAAIEIASIAQESGLLSVCFATTPFAWEGSKSTEQASCAISALHARSNAFVLIENNLIAQSSAEAREFLEGFKISDRWVESGIASCCRMLLNTKGKMRVDFAAFRTLFPTVGTRTLFSVGMGQGSNAQEEALTDLFCCPLLKTLTSVAGHAETLAIHIEVGSEPPLSFISETAQRVKERFGGDSRTLPSYAVNPDLGDGVQICVFGASGIQTASKIVRPRAPKKVPNEIDVLVLSPDEPEKDLRGEPELAIDDRRGPFESTRRIFEGRDLDVPTYIRKDINLDKALQKKKKELGIH